MRATYELIGNQLLDLLLKHIYQLDMALLGFMLSFSCIHKTPQRDSLTCFHCGWSISEGMIATPINAKLASSSTQSKHRTSLATRKHLRWLPREIVIHCLPLQQYLRLRNCSNYEARRRGHECMVMVRHYRSRQILSKQIH
jgi:hypothetical protein